MTRPRARWQSALAAGSLVVLGAAAGVTADRLLHRSSNAHTLLLEDVREDPVGTLDRFFDLRPEQRKRIAAIFESRQASVDAVWHETHVRLQAAIDSMVNEIAAVLDPEQAERFRTLADELHSTGRVQLHR